MNQYMGEKMSSFTYEPNVYGQKVKENIMLPTILKVLI